MKKLTGKFKQRYDGIETYLKSLDGQELTDEQQEKAGAFTLQLEILKGIINEDKFIVHKVDVTKDELEAVDAVVGIDIAKFNTPDKVTDVEGNEYQRVKGEAQILFKKHKSDEYVIILKKA